MGDAPRPTDDEFASVLQESLNTWASYLNTSGESNMLPRYFIDLRPLVSQTPPFLGYGLPAPNGDFSFACEERPSSLVLNGRSTWRTSNGKCDIPPRILPKQLLLAVCTELGIKLSEDSPLSDWPGTEGLTGYDRGNYLSILYLAWAYILSARWVELLGRSRDHSCEMSYTALDPRTSPQSDAQPLVQVDLGDDVCEHERVWWQSILYQVVKWNATAKYNDHVYRSPWSVSAEAVGFIVTPKATVSANSKPPSSATAIEYLCRFCEHHRLYTQCSAALAGVLFIPFINKKTVSLPLLRQVSNRGFETSSGDKSISISNLINDYKELLPRYMTLSSNVWGLRSLLHSTFFNPDIECNLVSAWLNPAFAVINSISSDQASLARVLANRQPRLGILWVGAIVTDQASSVLRSISSGMVALDLQASAWTGTTQTFLALKMGTTQGELIRREDECRLLSLQRAKVTIGLRYGLGSHLGLHNFAMQTFRSDNMLTVTLIV